MLRLSVYFNTGRLGRSLSFVDHFLILCPQISLYQYWWKDMHLFFISKE